ncbi:MAG: hypothetical protein DVB29_07360 [Verrucomicrobia bacterium]|nr:MAG: hypothetical protein DVB29_07360 [Verrucomicrobiota bacterium]
MNTEPSSEEAHSTQAQELPSSTPESTTETITPAALVKLNLPPKPVLANSIALDALSSTLQNPPAIPTTSPSSEVTSFLEPEKDPEVPHKEVSSKKKSFIGLPIALLLFLIALISLLIQLRFFIES